MRKKRVSVIKSKPMLKRLQILISKLKEQLIDENETLFFKQNWTDGKRYVVAHDINSAFNNKIKENQAENNLRNNDL